MKPICRHLHHQSKSPSKNCLIYFEKQYKQRGVKFFVWGRFPVPKSYRRSSSNNLLNIQRVNTLSGNKFFFSSAQKKGILYPIHFVFLHLVHTGADLRFF